MCILFIHVDPDPKEGDYRLILATNRDEYYKRPAVNAFWDDDGILGGRDMEPGREGGMWFGFTTKEVNDGKEKKHCLAALLNLTGDNTGENVDGRGMIVRNYLAGQLDFSQYARNLETKRFNGYNLVAVELSKDGAVTYQHSNHPKIDSIYSGKQTLGFGNSPIYSPLTKVISGRSNFMKIISGGLKNDELVEELLKFLKDETSHLPDMELQNRSPLAYSFLSKIFVKIEPHDYGTRTHTLVLVDYDWNLQFIEHTLDEPIDINNPKWKVTKILSRL